MNDPERFRFSGYDLYAFLDPGALIRFLSEDDAVPGDPVIDR